MLLDELDKMGADSRGDPAAAMLEVLDPEQNHAFTDHYLGMPFDLSRVTFLATANDPRTIPGPLRDRMEMIDVPGYTSEEKHHIAMTHVVPRVLDEHGLLRPKPRLTIPREAVEVVVRSYTREAGVRELERQLAAAAEGGARRSSAVLADAVDARDGRGRRRAHRRELRRAIAHGDARDDPRGARFVANSRLKIIHLKNAR